mgnify:CR=1 FL=1
MDGKQMTCLTPEEGNHSAVFNEDYTLWIDKYSTAEQAPVTVLRTTQGEKAEGRTLAQADLSKIKSAGWTAPEIFTAPGRDGVTPMWGIIQRPTNFDPQKKYPVIEYIYSGPGDAYTPKSFLPYNGYTTALAELGFIVVQLDAMGTSYRGKKFEEVCYKNLKDAGFPDRIQWIKADSGKVPLYGQYRVGIYGCSAGGQELWPPYFSTRNSTRHPTPVAVATTTGWTKSGGTNNGWAIRWTAATSLAPTWKTPTG